MTKPDQNQLYERWTGLRDDINAAVQVLLKAGHDPRVIAAALTVAGTELMMIAQGPGDADAACFDFNSLGENTGEKH